LSLEEEIDAEDGGVGSNGDVYAEVDGNEGEMHGGIVNVNEISKEHRCYDSKAMQ
jgi:hypothetical protein